MATKRKHTDQGYENDLESLREQLLLMGPRWRR